MSLAKRIIPCLDVDRGRVVKGTRFLELADAGDPVEVAARYEAEGADELVFLDITASHEGRDIVLDMVRRVARRMLEGLGFTVKEAADGRQGLDLFQASPDDWVAVVLDMTMPQLGGAEVLRGLRDIRADIPVLLSSGYAEQDAAARLDQNGRTDFIQKPYSQKALAEKLRGLVGSQ